MNPFGYLKNALPIDALDVDTSTGALRCHLVGDYALELAPEDEQWGFGNGVTLNLCSPRFAKVMTHFFSDSNGSYDKSSLGHQYSPRKFREDDSVGVLGIGMSSIKKDGLHGELMTGNSRLPLLELVQVVEEMRSVERIYHHFYRDRLGGLMAAIEGFWVFAFFWFEMEYSIESALAYLDGPMFSSSRKRGQWRLKRPIDKQILLQFRRSYDVVIGMREVLESSE